MSRVASLGMYDFDPLPAANDALWAMLRPGLAGLDPPESLDRTRPLAAIWRDPALLLAQTCGYPLMTELAGTVRLVATPCYDLPGCDGPLYCSQLVVRTDDAADSLAGLRNRTAAINGWDSQSGMSALRAAVAPLAQAGRFFARVVVTGAHLASVAAVREGAADVAAIDCVTHGLLARHRPSLLQGTRVLGRTPSCPGLPLVTAAVTTDADLAVLRDALLSLPPQPALGWRGVRVLTAAHYQAVLDMERDAAAQGYPVLA